MTKLATNLTASVGYSQANTLNYAINQSLLNVNTILPCTVIAVNGLTCDVQSLVNLIDNNGNPVTPPNLYSVPTMNVVGNGAGIIIEYAVGDTVAVGFCQRDISIIKNNWASGATAQNPASLRKFNLADGIIIAHLPSVAPTVFVQITQAGINITAPSLPVNINSQTVNITTTGNTVINSSSNVNITATTASTTTAPTINLNGNVVISGSMSSASAIIGGKDFATHVHAGTGSLIDSITMAPISGSTAVPT